MNKSILEADGEILVISQFTLHASTKKGNRPSYIRAARPEISVPLYEQFCRELSLALGKEIGTGEFGADMKVELMNDGPVTICIDTKTRNNDVRRSTETSGFLDKGIRSALFQRTHQYGDTDRRSGRTRPRHGTQVWRPILQERRKDNLDDEMADVLWVLLCLANQTGVNLTDAFCRNFEKKTRRDQTRHINNPKLKTMEKNEPTQSKYDAALAKYNTQLDDAEIAAQAARIIAEKVPANNTPEVKKFLFNCIDLTTLKSEDSDESVMKFTQKVNKFDEEFPDLKMWQPSVYTPILQKS